MYLDGFHSYFKEGKLAGDKQTQIRTSHFCKPVSPDMYQCVLYDGNGPDAKVIGIEYVITDKLFKSLSAEEQKMWHPHDTEVDSGLLILPGLPEAKQKEILGVLRSTHGKTWQTWPNLKEQVPVGKAELMWYVPPDKINESTKKSVAARKIDFKY